MFYVCSLNGTEGGMKGVLDERQVKLQQRELFRQNEKWQRIIDKLLTAWTQYFNFRTCHEDPYNWTEELVAEGEGLCVRWRRTVGSKFDTRVYVLPEAEDYRVVVTWLDIFNVERGRKWLGLRRKRKETKVLCMHHEVTIPYADIPKQCWRVRKVPWEVYNVNSDHLVSIINAITLLKRCAIGAKEDSDTQQERMEIFNDFLDGLADI